MTECTGSSSVPIFVTFIGYNYLHLASHHRLFTWMFPHLENFSRFGFVYTSVSFNRSSRGVSLVTFLTDFDLDLLAAPGVAGALSTTIILAKFSPGGRESRWGTVTDWTGTCVLVSVLRRKSAHWVQCRCHRGQLCRAHWCCGLERGDGGHNCVRNSGLGQGKEEAGHKGTYRTNLKGKFQNWCYGSYWKPRTAEAYVLIVLALAKGLEGHLGPLLL